MPRVGYRLSVEGSFATRSETYESYKWEPEGVGRKAVVGGVGIAGDVVGGGGDVFADGNGVVCVGENREWVGAERVGSGWERGSVWGDDERGFEQQGNGV